MAAATSPRKQPLTWLITGCSSGFGLAFARTTQSHGHNVIATSRIGSRTPELVVEITGRGGRWLTLDYTDANCGQVVENLEAEGTKIDVLVNCAGIARSGPIECFSEAEVRNLMETNFYGPFRLIKAMAPYMRRRRSGAIVNISSGAGMEARNTLGMYGASKAALDGMSKVLHKEMKDFNVRVLLVYLGTFNTEMLSKVNRVEHPLDADYQGTITKKNFDVLTTGDFAAPGDHEKAVQAIYDVIMGEGVGAGLDRELMIPLGVDMAERVKETQDRLTHMMDVFGDICNNVNIG
ncbi:hypothetical protein F5Y15DRAFT_323213 [Xylariaceae sp. FL0016]|nr:hypothetical protein F5Y15DRAFT_323213 [Xylariaceae sp. FL0016]